MPERRKAGKLTIRTRPKRHALSSRSSRSRRRPARGWSFGCRTKTLRAASTKTSCSDACRASSHTTSGGQRGALLTHAQYLSALVALHDALRQRADGGDTDAAATLDQLGLRTVSI